MVLCRYYQQGTCRFGDRCKFEHGRSETYYSNHRNDNSYPNRSTQSYVSPMTRQNRPQEHEYRPTPPRQTYQPNSRWDGGGDSKYKWTKKPHDNPNEGNSFNDSGRYNQYANQLNQTIESELMDLVRQDFNQALQGGQWLFSCYSFTKEGSTNVSGFDDISPEEWRYQFYQQTNKQVVISEWNRLQTECTQKTQHIITHTSQYMPVLREALAGIQPTLHQTQTNDFVKQGEKPIFSFRSPLRQKESTTAPTIFGGGFLQQPPQVLAPPVEPDSTIPFSFRTDVLPDLPIQPLGFGNPNQQKLNSITPLTSKIVAGGSFGSNLLPNVSPPVANILLPVIPVSGVYTEMSDLTDEEMTEFTADTFNLGSIPLRPPPREFCK